MARFSGVLLARAPLPLWRCTRLRPNKGHRRRVRHHATDRGRLPLGQWRAGFCASFGFRDCQPGYMRFVSENKCKKPLDALLPGRDTDEALGGRDVRRAHKKGPASLRAQVEDGIRGRSYPHPCRGGAIRTWPAPRRWPTRWKRHCRTKPLRSRRFRHRRWSRSRRRTLRCLRR